MVPVARGEGLHDLSCSRCGRRLCQMASLEAQEFHLRNATVLLTEEQLIDRPGHGAEMREEREAKLAGLHAVEEHQEDVQHRQPLTEAEKLQRVRSGVSTLAEEFGPEHSIPDISRRVEKAVRQRYPGTPDGGPFGIVRDLFTDRVVVSVEEKLLEIPYDVDDDGEVTLRKPREVRLRFEPVGAK